MEMRKGLDPTLRAVSALYLITLAHHVYGGVVFASTERLLLAIVFTALFALTLWLIRLAAAKNLARRAYRGLVIGFWIVLLGLYEGGFNHFLHVVLRVGGASPETMRRLYPAGSDAVISSDAFFQTTGVLTLVAAVWVAITMVRRPAKAAGDKATAGLVTDAASGGGSR